jgi:hypothetical protein
VWALLRTIRLEYKYILCSNALAYSAGASMMKQGTLIKREGSVQLTTMYYQFRSAAFYIRLLTFLTKHAV